ncbi:MAG: TrkA family potassium uptake protein [Candidatus Dependentiae bacterium]|nr:TrkA family potassium uptake protein [Candidatus Dependentiae bacterium]
MRKFCVIGLGRFGYEVAITLAHHKMEVLAVDSNEAIVQSIRDLVTQAVCTRVTSEESLRNIGVDEVDAVVVAIGENFAQSILITALLTQKLGIKMVIVRSISELHREILELIGARQVILPEQAMGQRLAEQLCMIASPLTPVTGDYSVGIVKAPPAFVGQRVGSLALSATYHLELLGKKEGETIVPLAPDVVLQDGDDIVLAGRNEDLKRVADF